MELALKQEKNQIPDSIQRKAQSRAYAELEHAVSSVNDGPHRPRAYDIRLER